MKHIPDDFRKKHSSILWSKMAGMLEMLIHDYLGVDLKTIWKVAGGYRNCNLSIESAGGHKANPCKETPANPIDRPTHADSRAGGPPKQVLKVENPA